MKLPEKATIVVEKKLNVVRVVTYPVGTVVRSSHVKQPKTYVKLELTMIF